jgi:hypothetical protein
LKRRCTALYLQAISVYVQINTKNPLIHKLCTTLQVVILTPRPAYLRYSLLNPLNVELNPIYHLLALLGGATIVVVSRLRVKEAGLAIVLVLTNEVIW